MKEDKFKKIRFKGINDDFILVCPKCGYSYPPDRDPKLTKNKKYRCPMCGYEWYRYNGFNK